MTVGSSQTHTLQPGDSLFCSHFHGMETNVHTVARWREDRRITRHRKVYKARIICVGDTRYGPWVDGSTTTTRVDLQPFTVTTSVPYVKTRCSGEGYPQTP